MENTYGEGDRIRVLDMEPEEPGIDAEDRGTMADDSDAKQFGEALLKSVQDLSRQIEMMGQRFTAIEARQRETTRGFLVGEGSGTSHHLQEHATTPH